MTNTELIKRAILKLASDYLLGGKPAALLHEGDTITIKPLLPQIEAVSYYGRDGGERPVRAAAHAYDEALAERLWRVSASLTGMPAE